ncbi:hypothetical protein EEJ42_07395 [Streptomyces botrytidirepellens]|uniref:Uncharacterized protein n=1 Tax=Streptomyces botrytidirepellens TaxID=2486417 RepID=A0A3M8WWV6_9ACTN|nr:hypothetical protein [Streptomyces botrytidirepellens]RNG33530.1 hypothetical protein EEJ42_07395 [Streptomyces botrytidirepellens]
METAPQRDTPVYSRLVAERGDVPAQARDTAERTLRELQRFIPPSASAGPRPHSEVTGSDVLG